MGATKVRVITVFAAVCLYLGSGVRVENRGPEQRVGVAVLAQVQQALGGERALSAVRSLTVRMTRRSRMSSSAPSIKPLIEFADDRMEVRILRPAYALFETIPVTFGGASQIVGFAQDQVIGTGRRWRDRQDYGYLLFTLLLQSDPIFPFAFRGADLDTLRFLDPNGVEVLVQLDASTRLPQRLSYDRIETTNDGTPTGRRQSTREELGGFRTVAGLKMPSMIQTFEGDRLMLERRIEDVKVNPPLTAADFKR